jgi:sulfur carrier protein
MSEQITVRINGEQRSVPRGLCVGELLRQLGVPQAGTAVELAGVLVPPSRYGATRLQQGQVVEIVRFVGGG